MVTTNSSRDAGATPAVVADRVYPRFEDLHGALSPAPTIVPLRSGLRAVTFREPFRLDPRSVAAIYDVQLALSPHMFGTPMEDYWRRERDSGMFRARERFYLLIDAAGAVVGWSSYFRLELAGERCLYFDSTAIVPELRRVKAVTSLYTWALAREFLRRPGGLYVLGLTRTQSVYRHLVSTLGAAAVHPSPLGATPTKIGDIGDQFSRWIVDWQRALQRQDPIWFEPDTMALRDVYVETYDSDPRDVPTDDWIGQLFARDLGPRDAFVVVAKAAPWALAAQRRYVRKRVRDR